MMPFDALNIGNHDLYDDSTVSFMSDSGFIGSWNGTYLTSNVLQAATGEPVGDRYAILKGPNSGVMLLTFGFLYHMTDHCPSGERYPPARGGKGFLGTYPIEQPIPH